MAKVITGNYRSKPQVKRPGVHAKTKTSNNKNSKYYAKASKGQGK